MTEQVRTCTKCGEMKHHTPGVRNWCTDCRRSYDSAYKEKHRDRYQRQSRQRQRRLRWSALTAYGGDPPRCKCCGEDEVKFLSIDHVNGGGNRERTETSRWVGQHLANMGYPPGYQVLCYNCNLSKGFHGRCPHED